MVERRIGIERLREDLNRAQGVARPQQTGHLDLLIAEGGAAGRKLLAGVIASLELKPTGVDEDKPSPPSGSFISSPTTSGGGYPAFRRARSLTRSGARMSSTSHVAASIGAPMSCPWPTLRAARRPGVGAG